MIEARMVSLLLVVLIDIVVVIAYAFLIAYFNFNPLYVFAGGLIVLVPFNVYVISTALSNARRPPMEEQKSDYSSTHQLRQLSAAEIVHVLANAVNKRVPTNSRVWLDPQTVDDIKDLQKKVYEDWIRHVNTEFPFDPEKQAEARSIKMYMHTTPE